RLMAKKILLLHPRKASDRNPVPHLGLGLLAAILRNRGHRVIVCDELLFPQQRSPRIADLIDAYRPDVLGLSIYTSTASACERALEEIRRCTDHPVMVGGPHATLYADELAGNPGSIMS
ncbi:MAG: cobalamin B12-binding domain-containing protein, partial [Candidatus Binatia bacterium]